MNMREVAQAMLNQQGFFVVRSSRPQAIGTVREVEIKPGYTNGAIAKGDRLVAKFKIVAKATPEDIAKQDAFIGITSESNEYCYRAVAE
jgi:hypothetical protein